MKKLNFLVILFCMGIISCTQSDNDTINPASLSSTISTSTADYATLIIGKWQLTEVGTPTASSPKNGCGDDKDHLEFSWSKTVSSELVEFKNNGGFSKDTKNDGVCSGSYKVNTGYLVTKSDCVEGEVKQPIIDLSVTSLTIETHTYGLVTTRYKYEKK